MQTVKIIHPFNPNVFRNVDIPIMPIGWKLTPSTLEKLELVYVKALEDEAQDKNFKGEKLLNNLRTEMKELEYDTLKVGLIYHKIIDVLGMKDKLQLLPDIEKYLHDRYQDLLEKVPLVFSTPELEIVPEKSSDFIDVEMAIYKGLRPLYNFLDMLLTYSGVGTEYDMYRFQGKSKSLRNVKSPVVYAKITSMKEFVRENDFLGDELLAAIETGEKLDPEFVWKNISTETFKITLNARVYGAIKIAWKRLGSPYKDKGGMKLYIASEGVDEKFANLAGLLMGAVQRGNAYPGFVRGNETTYRISSGIKTQRIMNAKIGNLIMYMEKHVHWSESEQALILIETK